MDIIIKMTHSTGLTQKLAIPNFYYFSQNSLEFRLSFQIVKWANIFVGPNFLTHLFVEQQVTRYMKRQKTMTTLHHIHHFLHQNLRSFHITLLTEPY